MALHGKTTIQLFDAETKELVEEVKSDNLVTNAFANVFGGIFNFLCANMKSGYRTYQIPNKISTLYSDIFGGVMIFDEALDADEDHIIPSGEECSHMIGCGNQSTGITGSLYTGVLSSDETVVTDKSVTFAWDFTTAQCNGKIASICLTSNVGGHAGVRNNAADANCNFAVGDNDNYNPTSIDSGVSWSNTRCLINIGSQDSNRGRGRIIDKSGKKAYSYYRGTLSTYDISKQLTPNQSIFNNFSIGSELSAEATNSVTSYTSDGILSFDNDIMYLYPSVSSSKASIPKMDKTGSVTTISLDLTNLKLSIDSFFSPNTTSYQRIINSSAKFIYNGYLYLMYGFIKKDGSTVSYDDRFRIYKVNLSNSEFTYNDITWDDDFRTLVNGISNDFGSMYTDSAMGGGFCWINDTVYYYPSKTVANLSVYALFRIDLENCTMDTHATFFTKVPGELNMVEKDDIGWIFEPYMWITRHYSTDNKAGYYPILFLPYLATINNISGNLVKDASKTMKVIYTLTEED
jgi:hypothetical protein